MIPIVVIYGADATQLLSICDQLTTLKEFIVNEFDALKAEVSETKTAVSAVGTAVGDVKTSVDGVALRVTDLAAQLSGEPTPEDITSVTVELKAEAATLAEAASGLAAVKATLDSIAPAPATPPAEG